MTTRRRSAARGYTLVELMMAIAIFTVAVLGIMALQKVAVASNTHAKNVSIAQNIAQSWAGQLEMDATTWGAAGFGTSFLNTDAQWQRPAYSATRAFGAAFDGLGNPLTDGNVAQARFCAHVRMSWLYPNTMGVRGNGALRAEIRVFWLKDGAAAIDNTATMCSATQTPAQAKNIGLATDVYHFVYQTVGVRQHSQI